MPSSCARFTVERYRCISPYESIVNKVAMRPWVAFGRSYKNCVHSYFGPKVGNKRTRGLVGCPEMGILEKEQEKRQSGEGPSELDADHWSAVMLGGGAEPNWQMEGSHSRGIFKSVRTDSKCHRL